MKAAKVDANQQDVVSWFRGLGATVHTLHSVGGGFPDLAIGYRGIDVLVEVKAPKGKLTKVQKDWHRDWRGGAQIVTTLEDCERVLADINSLLKPPATQVQIDHKGYMK